MTDQAEPYTPEWYATHPCMLCGAYAEGHVAVIDNDGRMVGRVCSKHTLWEVIRSQQFMVTLTHDPEEIE